MRRIADFTAEATRVVVGDDIVTLWRVADLERHVDREALLATPTDGVEPPEPPYWAHLWSGARVLAAGVPRGARRALEIGCGLGLPGLVAARRGARVTFVDRVPAALAFVRASAAASGVGPVDLCVSDLTTPALRGRFDLVLAAEVLYDRAAFGATASALARYLAPAGVALLADARRIDTVSFYERLAAAGLAARAVEHQVREEGHAVAVSLVEIRHHAAARGTARLAGTAARR